MDLEQAGYSMVIVDDVTEEGKKRRRDNRRAAAVEVCRRAVDAAEAVELLKMIGLFDPSLREKTT